MGETAKVSSEQLLKHTRYNAWQLIKLYWQSSERKSAYLFCAAIIAMTIGLVGIDVKMAYWFSEFYDALQAYKLNDVLRLVGVFVFLAFLAIIVQVYRYYLTQVFSLRWRRWLTKQFINRWLENRSYYYLENFEVGTDNPDQRIQEDIGSIVTSTIGLTVGMISALTTFPSFVYMLWTLSGVLTLHLGALGTWYVYGYLVWIALIYNVIGTIFTFKIGYPLISLNYEQQRLEATFRYAAIDLRTHAEHVALYRGEEHQSDILRDVFRKVLTNWYAIILRQKKILWFTGGFNQTAVILPLLAGLPNYFNKTFKLGGLMQTLKAFGSVQESLSYLINAYTSIADWRAVARRLTGFVNHMSEIEQDVGRHDLVSISHQAENKIVTENMLIETPNGKPLIMNLNQTFESGHRYVIKGESGSGKSTYIRTIAGIWPYASGNIELPANKNIMFLPQKPYMPMGTLAEGIMFPQTSNSNLRPLLESVLHDCHLDNLIPHLDEVAHWSEKLSPGEQQRVAFARVLLQKPDWVFLDESTSMLDMANEAHLYTLLRERLPNCTVISVGHRPSMDQFHDQVVDITPFRGAQPVY